MVRPHFKKKILTANQKKIKQSTQMPAGLGHNFCLQGLRGSPYEQGCPTKMYIRYREMRRKRWEMGRNGKGNKEGRKGKGKKGREKE